MRDKQWSQEIRLASPSGGFFDYVLGAYYFGQDLDNKSFTDYGPRADIWNGTPAGALSDVSTRGRGHIDTDSYALFAQGTWHLTERLDLTAGVRGTYEEKSAWVERYAPLGGAAVSGAAAAARNGRVGAYDSGDIGLHSVSPSALLSLSYRFSDQVLGYASLSHGEKSGGVNLTVASAPSAGADSLLIGTERANDAELGLKTTLLDNRLILNGNLFWTVVHGYQANAYDEANRTQYLTNAGDVRSRGLEFEATALPIRGLTLNFNASYNDVRYLSYKNAPCAPEVAFQTGARRPATSAGTRWSVPRSTSPTSMASIAGSSTMAWSPTSPPATRSAPGRWAPSTIPHTDRSPATPWSTPPPACAATTGTASGTCPCG